MTHPDDTDALQAQLTELKVEHHDLDAMIARVEETRPHDELALRRLKKRKLQIKDRITAIERGLAPTCSPDAAIGLASRRWQDGIAGRRRDQAGAGKALTAVEARPAIPATPAAVRQRLELLIAHGRLDHPRQRRKPQRADSALDDSILWARRRMSSMRCTALPFRVRRPCAGCRRTTSPPTGQRSCRCLVTNHRAPGYQSGRASRFLRRTRCEGPSGRRRLFRRHPLGRYGLHADLDTQPALQHGEDVDLTEGLGTESFMRQRSSAATSGCTLVVSATMGVRPVGGSARRPHLLCRLDAVHSASAYR